MANKVEWNPWSMRNILHIRVCAVLTNGEITFCTSFEGGLPAHLPCPTLSPGPQDPPRASVPLQEFHRMGPNTHCIVKWELGFIYTLLKPALMPPTSLSQEHYIFFIILYTLWSIADLMQTLYLCTFQSNFWHSAL